MRPEIVARLVAAMKPAGLDAVVTVSPENFGWLNGFVVPSQPLMRHRHAMSVVTADGRNALLAVDMEATTVQTRAPDMPVRIWAEFTDSSMVALAQSLTELGLASGRVGIEMDYLPAGDYAALLRALPEARFDACEAMLAKLRQSKTQEEIALMRRLSRIADQSITDALASVHPGDTEMDIAAALTRNLYALGAEQFKLMIVATGERSQLPNVGPTARRLQAADVCRVEIFSVIGGYQAGVCRTAVVERAPPQAERIWQHLVECKYALLDMIKPGASCREVYRAFIARLTQLDLAPISFVGHGIGLHLHEEPYLGNNPIIGGTQDQLIEADMVFSIEPLCYRTGFGYGMQLKDMIRVTASGCELLSDYADTDRLQVVR
ncbi:MAG: aminopeptidase P family protein [Proteobacteria bacterium]|nr:aminopeptidase P family protein [Burkholderiales bacterium]